jgi:hypothetical protein
MSLLNIKVSILNPLEVGIQIRQDMLSKKCFRFAMRQNILLSDYNGDPIIKGYFSDLTTSM